MMSAKDNLDELICPACQTSNNLAARVCTGCGESLALPRARLYLDRADADVAEGRFDSANTNMAQADLAMLGLSSEERKNNLLTARAFRLQGLIYYNKGQTLESRAEMLLALQNLEGVAGGERMLAQTLNQLGNDAFYERSDDAADYYQRSSKVAISIGEHAIASLALANLGFLYTHMGHIDEALGWYAAALTQAEQSDDPMRRAETYRLIAVLYSEVGPYNLALEYIAKALALREQITAASARCHISSDAGDIYFRYRDLEQAEYWMHQTDEISGRVGYNLVYNANAVLLSNLMRLKGDQSAALKYAQRAYNQPNLVATERGNVLVALALCYIEEGNWPPANRHIQRLEEICASQPSAVDQLNLARVLTMLAAAQGNWDEAQQQFQIALALADQMNRKYEAADLQEEYATRLLANPLSQRNSTIQAQATTLLTEVAAIWQEMAMPLRHARVVAMLGHNRLSKTSSLAISDRSRRDEGRNNERYDKATKLLKLSGR